jgi:hypothetical protein
MELFRLEILQDLVSVVAWELRSIAVQIAARPPCPIAARECPGVGDVTKLQARSR